MKLSILKPRIVIAMLLAGSAIAIPIMLVDVKPITPRASGLFPEAIENRRTELARQVAEYSPAKPTLLTDFSVPLTSLLRGLPGVGKVEAPLLPARPRTRVIHFLDFHFVDRDLLARVDGRTDWNQFLLAVEATQLDQAAALECLAKCHGLKQILAERLTNADMPHLPDKIAQLREVERHQPELKAQLAEIRGLMARAPTGSQRRNQAAAIEQEVLTMLEVHRADVLKMGTAIRLVAAGRLEGVLPLDDAKLLDAAGPGSNAEAVRRRERAMVRNALAAGPTSVLICGGSYDLTALIAEADAEAEYYRVAVEGFEKVMRGQ
jgi:hypothetical protein